MYSVSEIPFSDLQQTDAVYTRDEVQQVEDWLSSAGRGTHSLTSDDCVVLELRGGAFTQVYSLSQKPIQITSQAANDGSES